MNIDLLKNVTLSTTLYKQKQERDIDTESIDDIKIIASDRAHTWHKEEMNFYDIKSKMHADFEENKDGVKLKAKI